MNAKFKMRLIFEPAFFLCVMRNRYLEYRRDWRIDHWNLQMSISVCNVVFVVRSVTCPKQAFCLVRNLFCVCFVRFRNT